jgi:hypothetical protein
VGRVGREVGEVLLGYGVGEGQEGGGEKERSRERNSTNYEKSFSIMLADKI